MVSIDSYGLTDKGSEHDINQEQFLVADLFKSMSVEGSSLYGDAQHRLYSPPQGKVLVVAEGVGSGYGGRQAGQVALYTLVHYILDEISWPRLGREEGLEGWQEQLSQSFFHCQEKLEQLRPCHSFAHLGATITLLYIAWPNLFVVHAGDNRCYLQRSSELDQITTDHTVANRMIEEGTLTPEQAENSPLKNILINVVGGEAVTPQKAPLQPEFKKVELRPGDVLLLCSNSLAHQVKDGDILSTLELDLTAQQICKNLLGAARTESDRENLTAVVAKLGGDPEEIESPTDEKFKTLAHSFSGGKEEGEQGEGGGQSYPPANLPPF